VEGWPSCSLHRLSVACPLQRPIDSSLVDASAGRRNGHGMGCVYMLCDASLIASQSHDSFTTQPLWSIVIAILCTFAGPLGRACCETTSTSDIESMLGRLSHGIERPPGSVSRSITKRQRVERNRPETGLITRGSHDDGYDSLAKREWNDARSAACVWKLPHPCPLGSARHVAKRQVTKSMMTQMTSAYTLHNHPGSLSANLSKMLQTFQHSLSAH
jgi:hypothetical protein